MNVINMAHGELIMVGAYVTYLSGQTDCAGHRSASTGVWFVLAIAAAFRASPASLGVLLEMTLIRRLYGRPLDTLLATWGVSLVLQQAARSIFGAPNVQVSQPALAGRRLRVGAGLLLPYKRLFIIGLVICCVVGDLSLLYRSAAGRRMRAVMQNREMAACLGVATPGSTPRRSRSARAWPAWPAAR